MNQPSHENREEEILNRARRGDRAAFGQICEQYRLRIWKIAMSVARRRDDAEDLAQTAIVRAFQSLASFRGETTFEAWLCRITLNAAHDFQKTAWRRRVFLWGQSRGDDSNSETPHGSPTASIAAGGNSAQVEAEQRELQRRIRAAVTGLGARERVPIWLVYFEEFSVAEVARLEGVPESTVRSRIKVGLRKLEHTLGDLGLPEGDPAPDPRHQEQLTPPASLSARTRANEMKGSAT